MQPEPVWPVRPWWCRILHSKGLIHQGTRLSVGHRTRSVITGMACHWWVSSLVRLARLNINRGYPRVLCKPQCIVGSCERWDFPPFSNATDCPLHNPNEIPCHSGCASRLQNLARHFMFGWHRMLRSTCLEIYKQSHLSYWGRDKMVDKISRRNFKLHFPERKSNWHLIRMAQCNFLVWNRLRSMTPYGDTRPQ